MVEKGKKNCIKVKFIIDIESLIFMTGIPSLI